MTKHKADDQASPGLEMDRHGPHGLYGRDQGSEPGRVRTSYSCYCSCCLSLTTLPHLSLDERGFSGALVVAVAAPDVFVVLGIVVVAVMVMVVPAALVDVAVRVSVLDVSVTAPAVLGVVVVVMVVVAPPAVLVVEVVVVVGVSEGRGGERERLGRRSGRLAHFFGAMPTESEPDHRAKGQAAQGQRPSCDGGWGGVT